VWVLFAAMAAVDDGPHRWFAVIGLAGIPRRVE
jgi:hypothetical protein